MPKVGNGRVHPGSRWTFYTEGFDVKVLKGAEQWFAEGKNKQGSIEWIDRRLQVGDSDPMLTVTVTARGLGEFGDRHGYDFYSLSDAKHFLLGMGPAALEPMATWSNMRFIRRDPGHPDYDKLVPPATTFAAECL